MKKDMVIMHQNHGKNVRLAQSSYLYITLINQQSRNFLDQVFLLKEK